MGLDGLLEAVPGGPAVSGTVLPGIGVRPGIQAGQDEVGAVPEAVDLFVDRLVHPEIGVVGRDGAAAVGGGGGGEVAVAGEAPRGEHVWARGEIGGIRGRCIQGDWVNTFWGQGFQLWT